MAEEPTFTARARLAIAASFLSAFTAACGGGGGGGGGGGSGGGSPPPPPPAGPPPLPPASSAPALKTVYASNFLVGAAVQVAQLTDARDEPVLRKHFSSITAEYQMKPDIIGAGGAGTYNFAPGDALLAYCTANGIALRGHALVWHQTTPTWFFDGGNTSVIRNRLETYVHDVVSHWAGQIYAWDVVNEVASDTPGVTYRNSQWYQTLGPDYIEWAFRAARAADPACKLFINDYNTELSGKRGNVLAILNDLLTKGVPVDGFGHQCHINRNTTVASVEDAINAVTAVSSALQQHITELDISAYTSSSDPNYGATLPSSVEVAQAQLYRGLFNMFKNHPAINSVSTWGLHDEQSWLNTFPVVRTDYPLLFDRARAPKRSFWAVADPAFTIA